MAPPSASGLAASLAPTAPAPGAHVTPAAAAAAATTATAATAATGGSAVDTHTHTAAPAPSLLLAKGRSHPATLTPSASSDTAPTANIIWETNWADSSSATAGNANARDSNPFALTDAPSPSQRLLALTSAANASSSLSDTSTSTIAATSESSHSIPSEGRRSDDHGRKRRSRTSSKSSRKSDSKPTTVDDDDDDKDDDDDGRTRKPTPLPFGAILVVSIVQFAEAFQISVLFPFVPFMVRDFDTIPRDQIGTYAGILGASFAGGQLLSSYFWGYLSDKIGIRPVVLTSLFLTVICSMVFGFSSNYAMAVGSRFACGLLNGNIGVLKSFLGRITDSTNQAKGMAILSVTWGFGSIIAPALGGILARPSVRYPEVFSPTGIFGKYPYLLPVGIAASVVLLCFVLAIFFMKEPSAYQKVETGSGGGENGSEALEMGRVRKPSFLKRKKSAKYFKLDNKDDDDDNDDDNDNDNDSDDDDDDDDGQEEEGESNGKSRHAHANGASRGSRGSRGSIRAPARGMSAEDLEVFVEDVDPSSAPASRTNSAVVLNTPAKQNQSADMNEELEFTAASHSRMRRQMLFATFMYASIAFLFIMIDELFPLFAAAPVEDGGLAFDSTQIGVALAIIGIVLLLYTSCIYPAVTRRLSHMQLLQWSLLGGVPVFLLFPVVNYLAVQGGSLAVQWTVLMTALILRGICGVHTFTSVMLYINNSVPRDRLGQANGVGQSLAAATRTFGPALAGFLWSALSHARFPFHHVIPFMMFAVVSLVIIVLTLFYPRTIEKPFAESLRLFNAAVRGDLQKKRASQLQLSS